jgi:hypothetical protein
VNSITRARRPRRALSTSAAAAARPPLAAAVGILIGGLTLGGALAQPIGNGAPPVPDALTGMSITLVDRSQLAPGLSEVRIGFSSVAAGTGANRLLALSGDGATAAVASQVGPDPATLILARRSGSQLRLSLPGLIGAGFSPDGSWLATIDGSGSIWHVDAGTAAASRVADGPFIGNPIVEPAGSILALRVSSVEAPIVSRLVRIGTDGDVAALAGDGLVYGVQRMADGSVAYAAHRDSRTLLMQLADQGPRQLADLGEDAVNVALSPTADTVAFERGGQVFLRRLADEAASRLGPGTHPRFASDGRSVLVERASGSALLGRDGRALGIFDGQAGFAGCDGGCGS